MIANKVVEAVKPTESSMLALDNDDMKFEIFPPGQAATNIIPIATVGVMKSLRRTTKIKVTNGKANNCEVNPMRADLGFFIINLNCSGRMPNATPNIIKLNTMLIVCIPAALKFILTGSSSRRDSYIILWY
ncbi:hypothetical protein SDC9_118569 [bioreactor metagenome]|uniref:Uncharacterized protein n=1 Tax=bioreactor metagenome TaxID=1076179 RepID=A0A645C3S7_9ZZZZ